MMPPGEYLDLAIKMAVASFIPIGWAVILYPLMRMFKKVWPVLLIIAILFSFALIIIIEFIGNSLPTVNELLAYLFGIFFGTAVLSFAFNFKNKWLSALPKSGLSAGEPKPANGHKVSFRMLKNIRLRHVLQAAILLEERSKVFYDKLAEEFTDMDSKKLCRSLSIEEATHKVFIEKILYQWLPLAPDRKAIAMVEEEMRRWNILTDLPDMNVTEEALAGYAVEQEKRMADFYLSFEKYFNDAWKRMNIQILVMAERSHANKLIALYPQLRDIAAF